MARRGEVTCFCRAYSFPHRMTGGRCEARSVVAKHWYKYNGYHPICLQCLKDHEKECPVLAGVENTGSCEVWQEYALFHEIRITNRKCKF